MGRNAREDRYVCSSGRRVTDYNTLSRRGQGGSFRCKTVSTASVRKGAMTRRRASTGTLFSQQNEEHRVQSHRFSARLAYGKGISERNPASKIDQHRRRSTSGRCWAAADRSPAADIVLELRSSRLQQTRRKFAHLRRATTCTLGGLTPEVVQKGSERRFRSLCGRIQISLARSAAFWTGFERSARVAGKISLMQQISHNRPAAE